MKRITKILLGTAAVVAVGGVAFTIAGPGAHVAQAGMFAFAAEGGGHGRGWRGHRGGHGHRMKMLCSDQRTERLNQMIGFGDAFFNFNGEQKTAWTGLTATLRDASEDVGKRCDVVKAEGRATSPTARLARMEGHMSTGLSIIQKVRPSFDTFYGTLNEDQKAALEQFMKRGGHMGKEGREGRKPAPDAR